MPPSERPARVWVRLSGWAFLTGTVLVPTGFGVMIGSLRSGAFMISADGPLAALGGLTACLGGLAWLVSLVSGIRIVRTRPVVLFWTLPLVGGLGFLLLSLLAG